MTTSDKIKELADAYYASYIAGHSRENPQRAELHAAIDEMAKDAAQWQAYQKRKQEVIAAGMAKKALRDNDDYCLGDERYYAND